VGTNGKVHFKVLGSAPNRRLVVEWLNMQVPRVGAGNPGAATFQCILYEGSGRIEYVYGTGLGPNSMNGGASIGFGSSASLFASVTASAPSVAYRPPDNANNPASLPRRPRSALPPPTPNAPTNLSFSAIGPSSMTLSWTDNATNEVGYALYRSLDGVTYSFVGQVAANAVSSTQSGLVPSTTY